MLHWWLFACNVERNEERKHAFLQRQQFPQAALGVVHSKWKTREHHWNSSNWWWARPPRIWGEFGAPLRQNHQRHCSGTERDRHSPIFPAGAFMGGHTWAWLLPWTWHRQGSSKTPTETFPATLMIAGYYLEALCMLGFFCKQPLNITLRGVTNNNIDPSVDLLNTSLLQTMRRFVIDDEGLSIKISKRGKLPTAFFFIRTWRFFHQVFGLWGVARWFLSAPLEPSYGQFSSWIGEWWNEWEVSSFATKCERFDEKLKFQGLPTPSECPPLWQIEWWKRPKGCCCTFCPMFLSAPINVKANNQGIVRGLAFICTRKPQKEPSTHQSK